VIFFPRLHTWIQRKRTAFYTWYFRTLFKHATLKVYGPINVTFSDRITLGKNIWINEDVIINGRGRVSIGSNVHLSNGCQIQTSSLDPQTGRDYGRPIHIADNAWICTRAIILPGVTIGEGAIVGAGAVVTRDVAPHTIVVGVPARPLGGDVVAATDKRTGPSRGLSVRQ
jgi:acetyltransferase-like isoleucine patch superfamily enzyme